jgi:hypothetical protein
MKTCSKCKQSKDESEFHQNKTKKDGLQYNCKECQKIIIRQHYKDNELKYKVKAKQTDERIKELIQDAKSKPCMDCGKSYPSYVMDFDHREPHLKEFNIGSYTKNGINQIRLEIAKCDVVCANCHRIRTYK